MLALFAGVAAGIVTGLIPGLHLNSFLPVLLLLPEGAAFAIGATVSDAFFDFLPSVFLGVPDESTALSVLPAHRFVLRGQGLQAFRLAVLGGLSASLVVLVALPLLFLAAPFVPLLKPVIPALLAGVLAYLLLSSKRRLATAVAMALAVLAGFSAGGEPAMLMPLLAGFFGVSTIVLSLKSDARVPRQSAPGVVRVSPHVPVLSAAFALACSLLPGVSASVAGSLARAYGRFSMSDYLAALGGISVVYSFISVLAIFIVGNPRSGAGVVVESVGMGALEVVGCVLIALGVSAFIAWHAGGAAARAFDFVGGRRLNVIALFVTAVLALAFAGPRGLLLLVTAACVGLYCSFAHVRRGVCMASLILPAMLFYLA